MIAIEIYIQIYDGTWNPDTGKTGEDETELTESEKKKLKSKRKKTAAKKKAAKQENSKKTKEPIKEDPLESDRLLKEAQEKAMDKAKEWTRWLEDLRFVKS